MKFSIQIIPKGGHVTDIGVKVRNYYINMYVHVSIHVPIFKHKILSFHRLSVLYKTFFLSSRNTCIQTRASLLKTTKIVIFFTA